LPAEKIFSKYVPKLPGWGVDKKQAILVKYHMPTKSSRLTAIYKKAAQVYNGYCTAGK
jgi:hypothetical protein